MGCIIACHQDEVIPMEQFGKFKRFLPPGFNFLIPIIQVPAGELSTRQQEVCMDVQSKTQDNVFVTVRVAVQFRIAPGEDKRYKAFYTLSNPRYQISSYVEDAVRSTIPEMSLDRLFVEKQRIADNVFASIREEMSEYGWNIVSVLVTNIQPDAVVKSEMNEINANRRLRIAKAEIAEGTKYEEVAAAQAQAESLHQRGLGVARQRQAIIDGTNAALHSLSDMGVSNEASQLILLNNYFDAIRQLSTAPGACVVFQPQ